MSFSDSLSGFTIENVARTEGEDAQAAYQRSVLGERGPDWQEPDETALPPPFFLQDSEKAAQIFVEALDHLSPTSKLGIWGDYDADGNTSSAIVHMLASQLGGGSAYLEHYIPHRREGFGLNTPGIEAMHAKGVRTLVAVDCGTVAYDEISYACSLGMEVVVLDHHHQKHGEALPEGATIVNPCRADEDGSLKYLSAASLSYLFSRDVRAYLHANRHHHPTMSEAFFEEEMLIASAAIGLVADVVSVEGVVNRYLVREGLRLLNDEAFPAGQVIRRLFNKPQLTEDDLAFLFGPLINASGRVDDPTVGVRLLIAAYRSTQGNLPLSERKEAAHEVEKLAKELRSYNEERKQMTELILADALPRAQTVREENPDAAMLWVEDAAWHKGIVGIVSSRIKEQEGLPNGVGVRWKNKAGEEYITYSVRSVAGLDLAKHLLNPLQKEQQKGSALGRAITSMGGHSGAAGITIRASQKAALAMFADAYVREPLKKAAAETKLVIAQDVFPREATLEFVETWEKLGPFGQGFPAPVFRVPNVSVKQVRRMGDRGQHARLTLGLKDDMGNEQLLEGGTAFRATGSALEEVLFDTNRHNQEFDALVRLYSYRDSKGEKKIGFHLVDASPPREVRFDPSPEGQVKMHIEARVEKERMARTEKQRIKERPRQLGQLFSDPKHEEGQRILKLLYDAGASFLDTETTGLSAGHPDPARREAITQIAAVKVVKKYRETANLPPAQWKAYYALETFNAFTLPLTPAYHEYDRVRRNDDRVDYDQNRYEYRISSQALGVTGTNLVRFHPNGPIRTMMVGGERIAAKPFYKVAGGLAQFLQGTTPYAYNMAFDGPVIAEHLRDVVKPIFGSTAEGSPTFLESEARLDYMRQLTGKWGFPKSLLNPEALETFLAPFADPARQHCAFFASLWHKGESAENRLDHMAEKYGVGLDRDHHKHDALEDVLAMLPMVADQIEHATKKSGESPMPLSNRDLWRQMLLPFDPDVKVEIVALEDDPAFSSYQPFGARDEPRANKKTDGHLRVTFSDALDRHPQAEAVRLFFASAIDAKYRNPRTHGCVRPLDTEERNRFLLVNKDDPKNIRSLHHYLFKRFLAYGRMLESGLVVEGRHFDASSKIDLTVADGEGSNVTIENMPWTSLRRSMEFLGSAEARPHLAQHLALLKAVTSLPNVSIAELKPDRILIPGYQRDFGSVEILLPVLALAPLALTPTLLKQIERIVTLGTIPGVAGTSVTSRERAREQELDGDKMLSNTSLGNFTATLDLRQNTQMTMQVDAKLFDLATSNGHTTEQDHGTLPGGIALHRDADNAHVTLQGDWHTFQEIVGDIRNVAWLMYRFNNLAGVKPTATKLEGDDLILYSDAGTQFDAVWALTHAHVPFSADMYHIRVPVEELTDFAHHWYQQLTKAQDLVETQGKRKKEPLQPPDALRFAFGGMKKEAFHTMVHGRSGKIRVSDYEYSMLPVATPPDWAKMDRETRETSLQDFDIAHSPWLSLVNQAKSAEWVPLGYQLRHALHEMPDRPLTVSQSDEGWRFQSPDLQLFAPQEKARYAEMFRAISRASQSIYLSPVMDDLRVAVTSDATIIAHSEPDAHGHSPKTLDRLDRLHRLLKPSRELYAKLYDEVKDMHAEIEALELSAFVFEDVSKLNTMKRALQGMRQVHGIGDTEQAQLAALEEACRATQETLSMTEFKRYRLEKESAAFLTSFAKLVTSLDRFRLPAQDDADPQTLDAAERAIAMQRTYQPYRLQAELLRQLNAVWESGKQLSQTLELCPESMQAKVMLDDWKRQALLKKAAHVVEENGLTLAEKRLHELAESLGAPMPVRANDVVTWGGAPHVTDPVYAASMLRRIRLRDNPGAAPYMLMDTSFLLPLLLGQEQLGGERLDGYLNLLTDLTRQGVIKPVFTAGVLSELLNAQVPLMPEDLFAFDEKGQATSVKYPGTWRNHLRGQSGEQVNNPYPKWEERLEFLREMHTLGAKFLMTESDYAYMRAFRKHPQLQQVHAKASAEENSALIKPLAFLTNRELKQLLLEDSVVSRALNQAVRSPTLRLRSDLGELSIADAARQLKIQEPAKNLVIAHNGNDVRWRIVYREHSPFDYLGGKGNTPPAIYNPNSPQFDPQTVKPLGNLNFLTLGGFLYPLMRESEKTGKFLIERNETQGLEKTHQQMLDTSNRRMKTSPHRYGHVYDVNATRIGEVSAAFHDYVKGFEKQTIPMPWAWHVGAMPEQKIQAVLDPHFTKQTEYLEKAAALDSARSETHTQDAYTLRQGGNLLQYPKIRLVKPFQERIEAGSALESLITAYATGIATYARASLTTRATHPGLEGVETLIADDLKERPLSEQHNILALLKETCAASVGANDSNRHVFNFVLEKFFQNLSKTLDTGQPSSEHRR